jgi:hypothetical protein
MHNKDSPLIIGGSGGSGTRLFARLCILSGFHLGANLNSSLDSLDFFPFYEQWINKYLSRRHVPFEEEEKNQMSKEFKKSVIKHRAPISVLDQRWGFKNPRSMLLLPFLNRHFEHMKFIHVVRDGRDMAYSKNQKQVHKHGRALLGEQCRQWNRPAISIMFWAKSNIEVAQYGDNVMGDRYICVRFEDLCTEPEAALIRLLNFLEIKIEDISPFLKEIRPPASRGRWLNRSKTEQIELIKAGHPVLKHFGYI